MLQKTIEQILVLCPEQYTEKFARKNTMKIRERKQLKTHGEKFPGYMEKRFKKTCEVQGSEACKFEDNKPNK